MKLLIDGDEIIYKIGFQAQHQFYRCIESGKNDRIFKYKKDAVAWRNITKEVDNIDIEIQSFVETMEPEDVILNVNSYLQDVFDTLGIYNYEMYLSSDSNFRKSIATIKPYKGNRPETIRPAHYELIKQYLIDNYYACSVNGLEADDLLGINSNTENTIIISQDKDLEMIPGYHYNAVKRLKYYVNEDDANLFFFCQLLAGDDTDNIPGLFNVGLTTAKKYLTSKATEKIPIYTKVYNLYKSHLETWPDRNKQFFKEGFTLEETITSSIDELGKLLWIKRSFDSEWTDLLKLPGIGFLPEGIQ